MISKRYFILFLAYLTVLASAQIFTLFTISEVRQHRDSSDYLHIASIPITQKAFFSGDRIPVSNSRPPLIPILYKLLENDINRIAVTQTILVVYNILCKF